MDRVRQGITYMRSRVRGYHTGPTILFNGGAWCNLTKQNKESLTGQAEVENRALYNTNTIPSLYCRYIDDISVICELNVLDA